MLDLKNITDEEFSILVTPSAPQAAMYVKVEETGSVLLSSKVAEKLTKMPVQIRFNKDCTAIQICVAGSGDSVTFPKSGRKTVPNAAKILRENRIQFPAIFNGEICGEKVILLQDPLYEVVSTSHGYTLLAWEPHRKQW